MFPHGSSHSVGHDPAIDYIVLAYAGLDGVPRPQLMGQAFRDVAVEEKEQGMRRLGEAGLLEWDTERVWRTEAGHAALARITAAGERRGWAGYRRWVGAVLYADR
jgi:hypothetical protein